MFVSGGLAALVSAAILKATMPDTNLTLLGLLGAAFSALWLLWRRTWTHCLDCNMKVN